jgi:allantoate deiminase
MTRNVPTLEDFKAHAQRTIDRCRKLATFSEEAGRTTRTFLSPPMRDCHRELAAWLAPHGAQISIDAAGNFRAFYPAKLPDAPRLLIASHLDTVPDAGAFDGILGVVIGIALLDMLGGERLPLAIEIVGFSEEEGVRFGTPFIGSRALGGTIDDELLDTRDAAGISVREALQTAGLDAHNLPQARLSGNVIGCLEFHIEQGPVLDELNLSLSAVEGIVGQSRIEITFSGRANHAGTTPMHLRRDALAAAAESISMVERDASRLPDMVATVGAIRVLPGASNVIPGEVRLTLDVRHHHDHARKVAVSSFLQRSEEIAHRRKLAVSHRTLLEQPAVNMDRELVALVEEAIAHAGCAPHRMTSGAGHDAMVLAPVVPTAMMFVRSPGGISHSPEESVLPEDLTKALQAGMHVLQSLAASGEPARSKQGA